MPGALARGTYCADRVFAGPMSLAAERSKSAAEFRGSLYAAMSTPPVGDDVDDFVVVNIVVAVVIDLGEMA